MGGGEKKAVLRPLRAGREARRGTRESQVGRESAERRLLVSGKRGFQGESILLVKECGLVRNVLMVKTGH